MNITNFKRIIQESRVSKGFKNLLSCCFYYLHKKFLWGVFKRIDEKFFKFLFVGFFNTLFAYSIYAIFITIGFSANLALFFQYIIGILWNFKTTGSLVFKNHDNRLIFKFIGCYIITFILNSWLLHSLVEIIKINEYIAQAVLVLPMACLSFLLMKFLVFR